MVVMMNKHLCVSVSKNLVARLVRFLGPNQTLSDQSLAGLASTSSSDCVRKHSPTGKKSQQRLW